MLHNTFIAPAQGIITSYINSKPRKIYKGFVDSITPLQQRIEEPNYNYAPNSYLGDKRYGMPDTKKHYEVVSDAGVYISSDKEAIIGVSKAQPIDSPSDNVFRVYLDELPAENSKVYLSYDLYGIATEGTVARSINSRSSFGGYMVTEQNNWTNKREEIDPSWLKQGENTILFNIPEGASYTYKVKNIKIEVGSETEVGKLIINNSNVALIKDNKIYLKGFVKNAGQDLRIIAGDIKIDAEQGEFEAILQLTETIKKAGSIPVKAFDANGFLGQEILFIDDSNNADYLYDISPKKSEVNKLFKAFKSDIISSGEVRINVTDSAITKDLSISVKQIRTVDIPPLTPGMINVTKGAVAYRFMPDGTKFNKAVKVTLPYDTLKLPTGYTVKDIRTYFFDNKSRQWKAVGKESLDKQMQTITSQTTHFSDYINGIIQAPESPDASAFAPTDMSGIKAADPAAEITMIAPPQPSQKGDGTVAYPLNIPAGRKGVQPSLALQYNSNNASSNWFGLGWSLDMPSISLDTRWGMPTFDLNNETELYSLNGEMLMYPREFLPHRHQLSNNGNYTFNNQTRNSNLNDSGNKQFSLRIQGSFTKVERVGTSVNNYYWKVTTTDGTIYWYGGYDGIEENAVVKDNNGRIVHWGLFKVIDVFGNTMKYTYASQAISSNVLSAYPILNNSKSFYIDHISYTGQADSDTFPYEVSFVKSSSVRPDFTVNSKLGFKWVNPYQIKSINVKYNNDIIRTYIMSYAPGAFGKQLLKSIAVNDANDKEFNRHNFDYYDDVATNNGNLFGPQKTISIPSITANFSMGLGNGNLMNSSRINSSQNTETGYSVKPSVGIQIRPLLFNQNPKGTILAGAPFGESTVKTKGKISLMDIDGDGIDDVVYRNDDGIRYFPGQLSSALTYSFSPQYKTVHGIDEFAYTKTNTRTVFGDSWDLQIKDFFAGTQRTKSKAETKIYMTDANADGLIDIVNNGVVKFNSIDVVSGEPSFSAASEATPNMVLTTTASMAGEPAETQEEQEQDTQTVDFNDKYDIVRVWMAPTKGYISIKNTIVNYGPGTAPFTIELFHNGSTCLIYSAIISAGGIDNTVTEGCNGAGVIEVDKGDRLYFRIHTNDTGSNPVLEPTYTVTYTRVQLPYGFIEDLPYGTPYSSVSDIDSSIDKTVEIPGSGNVAITWPSFTPYGGQINGTRYRIYKRITDTSGNNTDTLVYPDPDGNQNDGIVNYEVTTTVTPSANLSAIPVAGDNVSFVFTVEGETSIYKYGLKSLSNYPLFSSNYWRPKLVYTPDSSATANGVTGVSTYPTPNNTTYRRADYIGLYTLTDSTLDPTLPTWTTPATAQNYGIKPNTEIINNSYLSSQDNGSFVFAWHIWNYNAIATRKVLITNGVIQLQDNSPIVFCENCIAENPMINGFEFAYFVDKENIDLFERYRQAVGYNTAIMGFGDWNSAANTTKTKMVSVNYKGGYTQLGQLLMEWGQFMYNDAYDTNPNTPTGPFGKLINDAIVLNPYGNINVASSPLLNSNCDPSSPNYQQCIEESMSNSLHIPSESTDFSSMDASSMNGVISGIQAQSATAGLQFDLPFMVMEPKRQDTNWQNDKYYGFYNSQYISWNRLRAGNRQESSDSSSSNSGAGLSYPELDNSPEPTTPNADPSTGMRAVNKIHRSSSRNYTMGYGPASYGHSESSYSNSVTDFIDMNGDGYPDVLTAAQLQKTNSLGGHLQASNIIGTDNPSEQKSKNSGLTMSRTFRNSGRNAKSIGVARAATTSIVTAMSGGNPVVAAVVISQATSSENDQGGMQANFGGTVNLSGSDNITGFWADINGDGLPDRVIEIGEDYCKVNLNYGQNDFSGSALEEYPSLKTIISSPSFISPSLNIPIPLGDFLNSEGYGFSISGNVGITASAGNTDRTFTDVNGDGLADLIEGNNVTINTGNSLSQQHSLLGRNLIVDSHNEAISIAGTLGLFYGVPICCPPPPSGPGPILHLKGGLTFDAHTNLGISQTDKIFKDLNGDGYPDYVNYQGTPLLDDAKLKVNYSVIGRTNMLKTVTNPLGGSFTMDYAAQATTYSNPHPRWVMTQVTVNDNYNKVNDGEDSYSTAYAYDNGYYDRREREFYGYEKVTAKQYTVSVITDPLSGTITTSRLYRSTINTYYNKNYFLKGLLKETYIAQNATETSLYTKTTNEYALKKIAPDGTVDINGTSDLNFDEGGTEGRRSACALLVGTTSYNYESGTTPISSSATFEYDNLARVVKYVYLGDSGTNEDNYTTQITYHNSATLRGNNLISIPKSLTVTVDNIVRRSRTTTLTDEVTGTIDKINAMGAVLVISTTAMKYDQYGNVISVTLPPSANAQQMEYMYTYDTDLHKYKVRTENSFGYSSEAIYDPMFDKITSAKDITGNQVSYKYDTFGRLITVQGPKELAAGEPYTIRMQYFPNLAALQRDYRCAENIDDNFMPLAITQHFDEQHPGKDIETYTFVDGLGRVAQVKKDIEMNTGTPESPRMEEMMSVSGKVTYDQFGRAIRQYHPWYEQKDCRINLVINEYNSPYYSTTTLDRLDRPTLTRDAEGNQTKVAYSIENGLQVTRTTTQQTSSVDVKSTSFTDVNGRVVKTINVGPNGDIPTLYSYSAIGELKSYTDAENLTTTYSYDMLGRKTRLVHPDFGTTTYVYDKASNLTSLRTANLVAQGQVIKYLYDYNRLSQIVFPQVNGNPNIADVTYEYGAAGSAENTGRLIHQIDATGEQYFSYGNTGELVSNSRIIVGPNIPTRTYSTDFRYDSWNRIQTITYPDGERVNYTYDFGGNLNKVSGNMDNRDYDYISRIDYDYFEQRTYMLYGNNTKTYYEYTPELRRLTAMFALTSTQETLFKNIYSYDKVGNIVDVYNNATPNSINQMGGMYNHKYNYDNLNRFIGASGGFEGDTSQQENNNDFQASYGTDMNYNDTHGITTKKMSHNKNGQVAQSYSYQYEYFDGSHRLKKITHSPDVEESFDYDANGNMIKRDLGGRSQDQLWDEANRLRVVLTPASGNMQHYIYDADGERILKASSDMENVYQNGTLLSNSTLLDSYTTYPSGYLTVKSTGEYTKHYYAGSQRIVSQVGTDDIRRFASNEATNRPANAETAKKVDEEKLRKTQIADLANMLSKLGVTPVFKKYEEKSEDEEVTEQLETKADKSSLVQRPEPPSQFPYRNLFFYHPDHLGTATWLTDANGMPYQFFLNLPFGETMAEQHSLTEDYETPYKFNGKELDTETGYYYYGARYYDPRISIWLSVDPLAIYNPVTETEFYGDGEHNGGIYNSGNLNPYIYCYQNPIVYVDPNGKQNYSSVLNGKFASIGRSIEDGTKEISSQVTTRGSGLIQMIGGAVETIVGGVGGVLTSETVVGAVLGYATAANGVDNTITGAKQLWTGESQDTYLHTGVAAGAKAVGASDETAENIATGVDYATVALGGGNSVKTGSQKLTKEATGGAKQWIRLDKSYSKNLDQKTRLSLKWGAGKRHLKKIGDPHLRNLNIRFRNTKLPGNSWRVKDRGHFHIKK